MQNDEELTAVVRSRQLHIYRNRRSSESHQACFNGRVASEEGKAYGKKILILVGKAQPKIIREDKLDELRIK